MSNALLSASFVVVENWKRRVSVSLPLLFFAESRHGPLYRGGKDDMEQKKRGEIKLVEDQRQIKTTAINVHPAVLNIGILRQTR